MKFAHGLSAILISAAVAVVQPQITMALTPVEVKAMSKEFTVRINGGGNGTGVIFSRKGNTYFVLTNRHVISGDDRYEIQTPDGNLYPIYRSRELPGLDLAVLQFTSEKNYRVANFTNSDQIKEKMTVYVAGWSADPLPGINERSYEFTIGSILHHEQRADQGYALVYDNEAIPGMSGGPVLDENGRIVGINGRASKDQSSGTVVRLGIPINFFVAAQNNPQKVGTQTTVTAPRQPTAEDFISLGGAKAKRKDYQGAIADYTQAIQLNPGNPDGYYQRGVIYSEAQNYQAALDDFNQVIRLSPKNAFAYGYRGIAHIGLKDYQSAIADSDQILRIDPNSATNYILAYVLRGTAHVGLGQKQEGLADIRKAQEQANKLRSQSKTATSNQKISPNGNDATAYWNRAGVHYNQGNKQAALQDLNQVTRINPKYSQAWYLQAFLQQELGRNSEAIASYNRAIEANNQWGKSTLVDAYLNRGNLYSEQGNYRSAIADFTEVIRLNPKNGTAYALRGLNYQREGKNKAAITDFNEAARVDPNNPIASFARGLTYHLQGDYQGALAAYEKATTQNPKFLPAVNNIGLIKYELQDVEGAIRQFQAAISISNQSAEPQLAQAVALYTKGEQERALVMAETALKLDKRFADVEFLKKNLWGDRLITDTRKLLQNPRIRAISSHVN